MIPLEELQKIRKRLGLTQKELAKQAGVSQSLIAKIEAGTLDPTLSRAQRIFTALEELREKEELKAQEVMHKKVVYVHIGDSVNEVIKMMRNKGISQVPVLSREKIVGIVTEKVLLDKIIEEPHKISSLKVGDVMDDTPPIISSTTSVHIISELLRDYPVVIVADKGEIKGIISKSDLLGKIR
ncbi:CBS domain-containing protein [Candidatus Woesearchaeota archaeon]|nr:CBS domain-containing protein [Candidatus Woesearchaeota archaeon]